MNSLSTYELLYELLYGGKANRHAQLEPISCEKIIFELERRANLEYGENIEQWVNWFLNSDLEGTIEEKSNIKTLLKVYHIEKKAKAKLGLKFNSLSD